MIIQVLLVAVGLLLLYTVLSIRSAMALSAWKKIGLVLLFVLMIVSVLFPQITSFLASLVGVGRGTDLVFYAVTAAFLVYSITQYLRAQTERDRVNRLARQIALMDAHARYPFDDPTTPSSSDA